LLSRPVIKLRESHCAAKWSQTTAQWVESRLSPILCLSILQPTFRTALSGDILEPLSAVLYSTWGDTMHNRLLPAFLYLAILLPTVRSTDFRLCHVWRYTTPDSPMCSALSVDSTAENLPTIRSDLYGDTTNDYLLCSTLCCDTKTDYLRCSTMSGVTTTDYPLCSTCRYYNRLSAMLEFCPFSLAFGSISSSYMAWVSNQMEL
jgi:hypothetical protein